MEIPNKKTTSWIPPIVRGITFDGETGLFVTTIESKKADLMLEAVGSHESLESLVSAWQKQFESFCTTKQQFPTTIGVEGDSLIMGLGLMFDQASGGRGVEKKPFIPGSSKRSEIMKNKISLVTGGAQGFGEGMVKGLVGEGGFVYIADMNLEGAEALAKSLNEEYGKTVAKGIYVNVTDEDSVEAMMDEVALTSGSLDLFVSNAGVLKAGSVKEMALKDFQFVTSVDYTGFFICTKFSARQMAFQNLGSNNRYLTDIVAISSKSGLEGSNKNGAYAGAKFGTIGLAQSFALELVTDNIKVNAVCPGNFLDGPLWSDPDRGLFVQYLHAGKVPGAKSLEDVRRFYESKVPLDRGCRTEDVVRAICYIVEQKYETGQAVPVTGGQVMLN
jgi:sorbitol-6-phosphate 2-dehydrogenase